MVARVLIKHSMKKKNDEGNTGKTVKIFISIVSVMLMFGLVWLFGALSVDKAAIVFQWFFVLFSTSQGFLLFIFFCIISKDARAEWKKLLFCNRNKTKRRGPMPSVVSAASRQPQSYGTKVTSLASKAGVSTREYRKKDLSDLNSSIAPLEMDELTTNGVDEEDTTNLIFSNDHAGQVLSDKVDPHDSQLPPQILFRLKRPYINMEKEKDDSTTSLNKSSELNTQTTEIGIDGYGEHNVYFDDEYDDYDYETDSNSELGFDYI